MAGVSCPRKGFASGSPASLKRLAHSPEGGGSPRLRDAQNLQRDIMFCNNLGELRGGGSDLVRAHDVAAYVLQKQGRMTTMKVQKLVYYAQAWSLAWGEGPLFLDEISAWDQGPVVRSLWESHRGQRWISSTADGVADHLTPQQRESIDMVLSFYGSMSPDELSDRTHRELPWKNARDSLSGDAITNDQIESYYKKLDVQSEGAKGAFLLKSLLAKVPSDYRPSEANWGKPVGREVW